MSWLLLTGLAMATDVGATKLVGIGASTGYPGAIAITGKYYIDQKKGIAAFLGSTGFIHSLSAEFQSEFYPINDYSFARFPAYWLAGLDLSMTTRYNGVFNKAYAARLGIYGGGGVALQFHEVPVEVFAELAFGIYPLNGCSYLYAACLPGVLGKAGGRWYF